MLRHGRVLLIVNLHKDDSESLMEEIRSDLTREGIGVEVCAFSGKPSVPPRDDFDLAFSLGGDGTVLYAARCMAAVGVPVLPINLGTLGFIASVQREEWRNVYEAWKTGQVGISSRMMLGVSVERADRELMSHVCLNDVVVSASGIAKIIRMEVGTESVSFGRYRADGLIVATPTGSTAYSVAAGGPILDPEMDAMILNPICPFTLSNRPIVIPSHETVIVRIEEEQRSGVLLTVDGQIVVPLEPGDTVAVRRSDRSALLVASDRDLFYRVLRTKLNWSGGPDA